MILHLHHRQPSMAQALPPPAASGSTGSRSPPRCTARPKCASSGFFLKKAENSAYRTSYARSPVVTQRSEIRRPCRLRCAGSLVAETVSSTRPPVIMRGQVRRAARESRLFLFFRYFFHPSQLRPSHHHHCHPFPILMEVSHSPTKQTTRKKTKQMPPAPGATRVGAPPPRSASTPTLAVATRRFLPFVATRRASTRS